MYVMLPGTNPSTYFIATFQTHLALGYNTFGDGHSFSQCLHFSEHSQLIKIHEQDKYLDCLAF